MVSETNYRSFISFLCRRYLKRSNNLSQNEAYRVRKTLRAAVQNALSFRHGDGGFKMTEGKNSSLWYETTNVKLWRRGSLASFNI